MRTEFSAYLPPYIVCQSDQPHLLSQDLLFLQGQKQLFPLHQVSSLPECPSPTQCPACLALLLDRISRIQKGNKIPSPGIHRDSHILPECSSKVRWKNYTISLGHKHPSLTGNIPVISETNPGASSEQGTVNTCNQVRAARGLLDDSLSLVHKTIWISQSPLSGNRAQLFLSDLSTKKRICQFSKYLQPLLCREDCQEIKQEYIYTHIHTHIHMHAHTHAHR